MRSERSEQPARSARTCSSEERQPRPPTTQLLTVLRARRKELGLTQRELADLAGVSTRFIHELEHGKATVQFDRVLAVATTLGLSIQWQVRQPVPDATRPR